MKIGSERSTWLDIIKGVPQGSILGPALFNCFINDLLFVIKSSKLTNFADDNTISASGKNVSVLKKSLQDDSQHALDWFEINDMRANPKKFQAICFGKPDTPLQINLNNDIPLAFQDSVKLLGIHIDSKLNFSEHVASICRKAGRQLNALRRLSNVLNLKSKMCIFQSFIRSNFLYCPLVWHQCGKQNTQKLEKLQERGLRLIFNDYKPPYSALLKRAKLPSFFHWSLQVLAADT